MESRTFSDRIVTIERYIQEEQTAYPEASGVLTNLLYDIALAAKIIASNTTRADSLRFWEALEPRIFTAMSCKSWMNLPS